MPIYPEELSSINNPDVLEANLIDYSEYNLKL